MAFDVTKTNPQLGQEIHNLLVEKGIETPITLPTKIEPHSFENGKVVWKQTGFNSPEEQIEKISTLFANIMNALGLNLSDDSLRDTPKRVAKMLILETMWGLDPNKFPKCTAVDNKMKYDEMIVEKNITVSSVCEHHWATIDGYATIAYIPGEKILGLSKMPRIVDYFSRRPQIQERLTEQIFAALQYILKTNDIAVAIHATHFCVRSRGCQDQNSSTVTSKLGGRFKDDERARAEFMALLPKDI